MKYIKYEDRLCHKQIKIIEIELKKSAKMTEVEWFNHMISGNILKVTDTIEEVCDAFVGKFDNGNYIQLVNLEERKQYPAIKEIYGAIWTDKGLIYVAKMNEKGELELL